MSGLFSEIFDNIRMFPPVRPLNTAYYEVTHLNHPFPPDKKKCRVDFCSGDNEDVIRKFSGGWNSVGECFKQEQHEMLYPPPLFDVSVVAQFNSGDSTNN
jgi:hypothetical protein